MDDGGVLFCSRTEVYFGLNPVGVRIWQHLRSGADSDPGTLDELLAALQAAYPQVDRDTLKADATQFLSAMAESELVIYEDPTLT